MRFFLFDKIISFEKGSGGSGIKNVSLGEDFFIKHFDRDPVMPEPLVIEAVAQVGGWVIAVSCDYKYSAIMGKVGKARFHRPVRPGDQLRIDIDLITSNDYGSTVNGLVKVDGEVVAEIERLTYIHHESDGKLKEETLNTYIYNSGGFLDRDGNCKGG